MVRKTHRFLLLTLLLGLISNSQEIFEPNFISVKAQHDVYISLNPNEDFLLFTRFTNDYRKGTIYFSKKKNGE
jgi:hypothetical protein